MFPTCDLIEFYPNQSYPLLLLIIIIKMDTDKKIMPTPVSMPNIKFDETLSPGFELRIDSIRSHIKVLVISGMCEVFGRELPVGEPVFFHAGENIAIFCWKQTRIQICGDFEQYVSD